MAMEPYSQFRQYRNDLNLKEYWSTAAPSASTDLGPFKVGDIFWNTSPAAGGGSYIGWVCVSGGATGATSTWKGFGLLQT
jgi:hypothetical protein